MYSVCGVAPGLKHTWCELPGLCNQAERSEQGRVTWERNHDGRRTEDKPFRTQIGPGTPLPICPTKPGSPGAPIKHSREQRQWSKAQSRYMMCSCWICSVSSEQQLMCVKDKDRARYINQNPFLRQRCSLACFVLGKVVLISTQWMDPRRRCTKDWTRRKSSYWFTRSWQTAALWQGLGAHSSMSSSQRGPENPVLQSQLLEKIVNIDSFGVMRKKTKTESEERKSSVPVSISIT